MEQFPSDPADLKGNHAFGCCLARAKEELNFPPAESLALNHQYFGIGAAGFFAFFTGAPPAG
jgi:hypothetical protein